MKILFSFLFVIVLMTIQMVQKSFYATDNSISLQAKQNALDYKKKYALRCSPDLSLYNFSDSAQEIPLLDGWGDYRMPVTSTNDSAYIYFQQGINLYYGFHIIESLASFEKSISFDKKFAMAWWGKALAYGPNINDIDYHASPDAITAMQTAKELDASNTEVEKALINAVQFRFSADTSLSADQLKLNYRDAMKKVYDKYPDNADVAALYADALMVIHPWDLYDKDFNPKPWTPEIVDVLQKLVDKYPNHPGGCHYYIHAIEGSAHPERGLDIANRLGSLMPGVSHLVHMPSHIYIRSGYYKEGVDVNVSAIQDFYNYAEKFPASTGNAFLYYLHNAHMEATCSNMDGRFETSLAVAEELKKNIDPSYLDIPGYLGTYVQYVYMTPVFTLVRFGKWGEILNYTYTDDSKVYAAVIGHFAKGMAYAHQRDFDNANTELETMQQLMTNEQMSAPAGNFNPAISGAKVAEKILQATITMQGSNTAKAIVMYKEAVALEDAMYYNEPKDWPIPARQYLGNALLVVKNYTEAEQVLRKDLTINPNNGWSLTGLATALKQLHKNKEADKTAADAAKAFERSDVKIEAPVF